MSSRIHLQVNSLRTVCKISSGHRAFLWISCVAYRIWNCWNNISTEWLCLTSLFPYQDSCLKDGDFSFNKELKPHSKMTIGNSSSFKGMQSNILFGSGALMEDHMLVFSAIKRGGEGERQASLWMWIWVSVLHCNTQILLLAFLLISCLSLQHNLDL